MSLEKKLADSSVSEVTIETQRERESEDQRG
jgi:hypothetical protein